MNRENTLKIALALVALPLAAHAGFPSIFGVGVLRLTFGGLFIGMVDGLILWLYSRAQRRVCRASFMVVVIMVLSNVLSFFAYIGLHNLSAWGAIIGQGGIERLKLLVLCGCAMTYLLKMIVEFPFVYLALYVG